tara:strand:- start:1692 stop:2672 length:981 start_codon:yes stop_codon:yes gene_type:complete
MRHYEFIVEYKTEVTKGRFEDAILKKLRFQDHINTGYLGGGTVISDWQRMGLTVMGFWPGQNEREIWPQLTQELYDQHKEEIVNDFLKRMERVDPTPNNQYVPYLIKWYVNSGEIGSYAFPNWEDATSTLKESLIMFYKLRERIPQEYRDIGQFDSASEFMNTVQDLQSQYGKQEKLPTGEYEKIYESEFGTAYWPMDQEAACYLGQGTQWCTAATRSTNYFDQYNDVGGLIIIILKEEVELKQRYEPEDIQVTKVQAYVRPDSDVRYIWSAEEIRNQQDIEIEPYMLDPTYNGSNDLIKLWSDDKFQEAALKVAEHYRPKDWGIE